tara:strand:- start:510 stop:716 length:207 start_codon:yes stop_codon:yes gene_type:complete
MKRKRSAKQRANDKRLGEMAKARARKTTTRKRRTTRKGDLTLKRKRAYTPVKKKVKRKVKKSTDAWSF